MSCVCQLFKEKKDDDDDDDDGGDSVYPKLSLEIFVGTVN